jgi:hypothetical protein
MDVTRKLKKHVQTRPLRGVYIPSPAAVFVGGHSVKIMGWGTDETSKLPYWIVANSYVNLGNARFLPHFARQ